MILDSIKLDFDALEKIRPGIDNNSIEYIYHKFFDNPGYTYEQSLKDPKSWQVPDCWLARYYCYYVVNKDLFLGSSVLDLGANFNFYGTWALDNGATSVHGIEPDPRRFALGNEYVNIKGYNNAYRLDSWTVDQFMQNYRGEKYDVVLLLDMIYFLTNGIELLDFLKNTVKPKYVFLESNIDFDSDSESLGHFKLIDASTDTKHFSAYSSDPDATTKMALLPSKNALRNVVLSQGWDITCYYDYLDFLGRGESPPRKEGRTNFYVLRNGQNS